jgi:hypothetical protein
MAIDLDEDDRPLVLIVSLVTKILQSLGFFMLAAYGIFFLSIIAGNTRLLIDKEAGFLRSFQRASTNAVSVTPEGSGGGIVPGIESLPPGVALVICIIAAVFFAYLIVLQIEKVIELWIKVAQCKWKRSILSFLVCLWQVVVAVFATLWVILLIIVFLFILYINIAALIEIV